MAGGIPIVTTLREALIAHGVDAVKGILNGTCNYILTEMEVSGRGFAEVLKEAQAKGYAEADPDAGYRRRRHGAQAGAAFQPGLRHRAGSCQHEGRRHRAYHAPTISVLPPSSAFASSFWAWRGRRARPA